MAKDDPAADLLRRVPLFADLSKKELALVASITKPIDFPAAAAVVTEGERTGRFYIIMEGEAEVILHGRFVRRLCSGDFFGEMALLDEEPRAATVRAATPLQTVSIAPVNFRSLLKANADITFKMLRAVCQRLRAVERALL